MQKTQNFFLRLNNKLLLSEYNDLFFPTNASQVIPVPAHVFDVMTWIFQGA
ncbi:hypothetical protein A33Q_3260 [Indibacter alkaliphilus LW1]|uniref:Uncharacterized protein n=1 Tax=Indibacter alkaliphilus (strain CCUG 57479 / KCTC 22604 / LW1) TaxID=1189612 RepID=S2DEA8_INDAL|nr:hypothetical protein A33Q_3260 [Indibacter alkaliphilus LW1]